MRFAYKYESLILETTKKKNNTKSTILCLIVNPEAYKDNRNPIDSLYFPRLFSLTFFLGGGEFNDKVFF